MAWSGAAAIAVATSVVGLPAAALAQSDCTCLLAPPASGPVGSISQANGEIFLTGAGGFESGGVGSAINPGDVVSTGASSTASLALGGNCNIALGPSSTVTISPVGENLCVRVTEDVLATGGDGGAGGGMTVGLVAAGAIVGTAAVVVGLGLNDSVSE